MSLIPAPDVTLPLCCAALALEALVGYPDALFRAVGHPVTWMGRVIAALDARLNAARASFVARRLAGVAAELLVLQTEFATGEGRLVLTDFMPVRRDGTSAVVRRLEALDGPVEVDMLLRMCFGFGEIPPWWERKDGGFVGEVGPDMVMLRGPGLSLDGEVVRAQLTLRAGERVDYVLQYACSPGGTPDFHLRELRRPLRFL